MAQRTGLEPATTDKGFLSKTTTQSRFNSQSDKAISSNIEGNKVIMDAGNDVNLTATNTISDKGTSIKAGNNVNILAAQNTSSTSSESSTKKSGVFSSGGLGFTIGKQKTENDNTQTALTHTASNIGAIDGNVSIEAGNYIQQTGSNVIAGIGDRQAVDSSDTERGNVVYRAKAVDIDNAMDKYTNQSEQKFKQSGLTVFVSNSLVDSAQNIDKLINAAGNTSSPRMKGLAAGVAVLKAKALYGEGKQAAKALQTGNLKDVGNTRIQATSINFGSIVGGEMNIDKIDRVIGGSSVGIQACHYGCIGGIYTKSKDKVVTYGLGTSQIGISGGNMVRMSKLTEKPKERLFSLIELVAK